MVHACQCRSANCGFQSCHKMKRVVSHTRNCKRKNNGDCPICKQLIALCCYHAKVCQDDKCPVQFCQNIKFKLKESDQRKMQWKMLSQTFNDVCNPRFEYFFILALMKLYIDSGGNPLLYGRNGSVTKCPSAVAEVMASSKNFPINFHGINLQHYVDYIHGDLDISKYIKIREKVKCDLERDTKMFLGVLDGEPSEKKQKIGL